MIFRWIFYIVHTDKVRAACQEPARACERSSMDIAYWVMSEKCIHLVLFYHQLRRYLSHLGTSQLPYSHHSFSCGEQERKKSSANVRSTKAASLFFSSESGTVRCRSWSKLVKYRRKALYRDQSILGAFVHAHLICYPQNHARALSTP